MSTSQPVIRPFPLKFLAENHFIWMHRQLPQLIRRGPTPIHDLMHVFTDSEDELRQKLTQGTYADNEEVLTQFGLSEDIPADEILEEIFRHTSEVNASPLGERAAEAYHGHLDHKHQHSPGSESIDITRAFVLNHVPQTAWHLCRSLAFRHIFAEITGLGSAFSGLTTHDFEKLDARPLLLMKILKGNSLSPRFQQRIQNIHAEAESFAAENPEARACLDRMQGVENVFAALTDELFEHLFVSPNRKILVGQELENFNAEINAFFGQLTPSHLHSKGPKGDACNFNEDSRLRDGNIILEITPERMNAVAALPSIQDKLSAIAEAARASKQFWAAYDKHHNIGQAVAAR